MILITGSRGWLGTHLCKYFENIYHYDLIDGNDILEFKLPSDKFDLIIPFFFSYYLLDDRQY